MVCRCLIPLLLVTAPVAAQCNFLEQLSPYQSEVAYQVYRAGAAYDLGLTSVAIAWEESKLGIYKTRFNIDNVNDISVGVLHTAVRWKTVGMSSFERGMWVQAMIQDDANSIQVGVSDILYWQGRSKGKWAKGVMMYNTGGANNYEYLRKVSVTVNELKSCKF